LFRRVIYDSLTRAGDDIKQRQAVELANLSTSACELMMRRN